MKNVLLIVQNNSFPWDKRVYKEAMSLQKHGYKVSVISPRSEIDPAKRDVINNIEVLRYKDYKSDGSLFGFITEYMNALTKIYLYTLYLVLFKKVKAVHVANPPDFFWPLALLLYLFNVKFIYDQHDLATIIYKLKFTNPLLQKFINFSEKMSVKLSSGIIVANKTFKERLTGKSSLNNKPCSVVYNGPEEHFEPKYSKKLHDKYAGFKVALFVGLMTINDNIEIIIEAVYIVVNKLGRKNIKFVLVGDGEVRKYMQELAVKLQVENYIDFTGLVNYNEVMEYIELADVCLVPDQPNGLNEYLTLIKVLEYMKTQKPFVAFELKETMEMAKDSGLYAKDIDDFTRKVLYFIDNPEIGRNYGYRGHKIIMKNFLWSFSELELLNLYKALI